MVSFQETGGQLFGNIFNNALLFVLGIVVFAAVGGMFWYFFIYKRKFNISVKIISERAGDKNKIFFDKAAIFRDKKDSSNYFRLWATKVSLPAPKFNILQNTIKGDYLEIYRTSENSFYFLTPTRINKKLIIRQDGKAYGIGSQESTQINPDMEFWAVKRKGMNKKMFDTDKLWMKLLVYIPHILAAVVTIFVLYLLLSYLPDILAELKSLATELNIQRTAEITTVNLWKTMMI